MPLDSTSWNDKPEPDGLRRLRRLEKVIEGVPAQKLRFDLYMHRCGSAGCAIGWAAHSGQFEADGLTLADKIWPRIHGRELVDVPIEDRGAFFGVDTDEYARLFLNFRATKAEFLRRLRSVISEKAEAHARETVL